MPDSVYTSLENGDQSYVPLSTNQPSSAVQRPPCFTCSASPPLWVFVLPAGLLHAAAVLLLGAGLLPAAADAKLCLRVTRES